MIFQCSDLERALRTAELMPDARAHAEGCVACREQLALWTEISKVAPQLHHEWDSDLWPAIQAKLSAETPRRRPPLRWQWVLAAAAVVVLAVTLSTPWRTATPASPELLTDTSLREVERAEAAYARSIGRLAALANPGLEQSPSPLAAVYREKLLLLDSAIADVRGSMERNRYNAYLRGELASLYGEKKKTLQEWTTYAKRN